MRRILISIRRYRAFLLGTYEYASVGVRSSHDFSFNNSSDFESLKIVCEQYMQHKFDLLGSGWVNNSYDSKAFGLYNFCYSMNQSYDLKSFVCYSNRKRSLYISSLIDSTYEPIDWQKDFKTGFRWDSRSFYCDQRDLGFSGSDIKVPWEIGRLQHLPQISILSHHSSTPEKYLLEFRNQIYDFISANPPSFGVQWVCTMDVGIRVANMVLAYCIFKPVDKRGILSEEFESILSQSIYEHGLHIVRNLEYNENITSNHYLSNIVGLLFASAHLERTPEVDAWLGFSLQEMISEMKKQFYEDGSNFEASTCYHRLSTELMVFGTALILGLEKDKIDSLESYSSEDWKHKPLLKSLDKQEYCIKNGKVALPSWFKERLLRAGKFTADITKPNGRVSQFGDNDSGRLFRLSPNGILLKTSEAKAKYENLSAYESEEEYYWDEDILNHWTLISAMNGLGFLLDGGKFTFEQKIISVLAKGEIIEAVRPNSSIVLSSSDGFDSLPEKTRNTIDLHCSEKGSLLSGCKHLAYPDTGIFIIKSDRLHLVVSAGPVGQNGNGGHGHNDKLSFELTVDGEELFLDPGTYLYTAIPEERNRFRSSLAHNTVIVRGEEQNGWFNGRTGLFSMKPNSKCFLFAIRDDFIDVGLEYRGIKVRRKFTVCDDFLLIDSSSNRAYKEFFDREKYFSNGYGKLEHRDLDKGNSLVSREKEGTR